jgi:hypothetical protein
VNAVAQTLALFRLSHLRHSLSTLWQAIISLKDLPQHSPVSTASKKKESLYRHIKFGDLLTIQAIRHACQGLST